VESVFGLPWNARSAWRGIGVRLGAEYALEQNDEWLVSRRYLSVESLTRLYETTAPEPAESLAAAASSTRREIALAPA